jgi:hypothetical protein
MQFEADEFEQALGKSTPAVRDHGSNGDQHIPEVLRGGAAVVRCQRKAQHDLANQMSFGRFGHPTVALRLGTVPRKPQLTGRSRTSRISRLTNGRCPPAFGPVTRNATTTERRGCPRRIRTGQGMRTGIESTTRSSCAARERAPRNSGTLGPACTCRRCP